MRWLVGLLLLTACAEAPVVQTSSRVEVPIPVVKPCVDARDIPPPIVSALPDKGAVVQRQAAGVYADVYELRHQNEVLRAMLAGCVK